MTIHVFVGPSSRGVHLQVIDRPDVKFLAPARRGDIRRLVEQAPPSSIALVDGTFHHYPAVGHAEIRQAIAAGWQVWGLCSMGAIRAAEMQQFGMLGYGAIFECFKADPDFSDDEVTLLHQSEPPYMALSEPLVNFRACLHWAVVTQLMDDVMQANVIGTLKERWYGLRTVGAFRSLLDNEGASAAVVEACVARLTEFNPKEQDFRNFMTECPWFQKRQQEIACRS